MSKTTARWILFDSQSLENSSDSLRVFLDAAGAIERSAGGLKVGATSITNDMLAGSIALTKLADTVIKADGTQAMTGALNLGSSKITSLANGTESTDAVNKSQLDAAVSGLDFQSDVLDIQTDATLDPGASPTTGDRYVITASGTLHANFGTIAGIADDDIVEYDGSDFVVSYDVSVQGEGALVWDRDSNVFYSWDGTNWSAFGGLSGVTAGDGIDKTGNTLDIVVSDFAGTGLEDDTSNNLRLATQGNGITGGGGTTLSVLADVTTGGDTAAVSVGANGVGIDVTTLDGDHLDVDFTPTNYTPDATPAEAADVDDLAAHLKGIDTAIGAAATGKSAAIMHKITAGEITAGYLTLPSNPEAATLVHMQVVNGSKQINKQNVGATGVTPDFDVLNTTEFHINNNGTATGLSEVFLADDVLDIWYTKA